LALLTATYGETHPFTVSFITEADTKKHPINQSDAVRAGLGILKVAQEDYANGYVWKLKERVHADVFDDYLEIANSLLNDGGYKDAAAVIAGSTLEGHLIALSIKYGLPIAHGSHKPIRAALLNQELKKLGAFNTSEWRQVDSWLDLRNAAAHGDYGKYDAARVKIMIDGIRYPVVQHPG
jgi:hypothetical protein